MGEDLGLGRSGTDCELGTFCLDDLRVFLSRLPLYAVLSARTWIDSDWPDLRSRRSRELRGPLPRPLQASSPDLFAVDWLENAVRTSPLYKPSHQRKPSLSLPFPYHKTTTPSTQPYDPALKSNGESNGDSYTHTSRDTPHPTTGNIQHIQRDAVPFDD